ncbi:MAG: hypothetical protein KDA61_19490 [Planctomycetales bacterium]|nr:hypothetical protein [Planctomycetales bacterium]
MSSPAHILAAHIEGWVGTGQLGSEAIGSNGMQFGRNEGSRDHRRRSHGKGMS